MVSFINQNVYSPFQRHVIGVGFINTQYMKGIKFLILLIIGMLDIHPVGAQLQMGDNLPDFVLMSNTDSLVISKDLLNGKYVLIDFWASWCAPCRKANKKLVKLQRHSKNLDIIGISIDTDKSKWIKAIHEDMLSYKQLLEKGGFDGDIVVLFGVEQLPSSYLFDPLGKLIVVNPDLNKINSFIEKNKKLNH